MSTAVASADLEARQALALDAADEIDALLEGAAAMLVGDGAMQPSDPYAVLRVVSCARERVEAVQHALDPYI